MNILIITSGMESGGAETHIAGLCRVLLAKNHKITLVSAGGAMTGSLALMGVRCVALPLLRAAPHSAASSLCGLFSLIREGEFDIVHAHSRPSALYADIVCRILHKPLVVTVHAQYLLGGARGMLTRTGKRCIAVSEDIARHISVTARGQGTHSIKIIPNGIDTEKFTPSEKRQTDTLRIAFVSRLDKDCSRAAHALCTLAPVLAARQEGVQIVIVGGGSEYEALRQRADKINRRHGRCLVRVIGGREDIVPILHSSNVLVGVSRAALEGMSCALPVILCGNEGYFGLLDSENKIKLAAKTNFCARGESEADEARLLKDLTVVLEMSEDQRGEIGRLSRSYVCKHHSEQGTAELTEGEYRRARGTILLAGYYGYGNVGDEALCRAAVKRAACERGEARVEVLKGDARKPREYNRMSPLAVLSAIKKADTLVLGGGTLLQSDTSRRSLWYYIALITLAKGLGRRVELWGNGLQGVDGRLAKKALARALRACSYVGVRDGESAEYALGVGVPRDRVRVEGDLAERTLGVSAERAQKILRAIGVKKGQKYAVIAAKGSYKPDLGEFSRQVRELKKKEVLPIYVAMYPREDARAARRLREITGGVLAPALGEGELVGIMRDAECVLASRYHAAIFARAAGARLIVCGHEEKLNRLKNKFLEKSIDK